MTDETMEALAGRPEPECYFVALGLSGWSIVHESDAYRMGVEGDPMTWAEAKRAVEMLRREVNDATR